MCLDLTLASSHSTHHPPGPQSSTKLYSTRAHRAPHLRVLPATPLREISPHVRLTRSRSSPSIVRIWWGLSCSSRAIPQSTASSPDREVRIYFILFIFPPSWQRQRPGAASTATPPGRPDIRTHKGEGGGGGKSPLHPDLTLQPQSHPPPGPGSSRGHLGNRRRSPSLSLRLMCGSSRLPTLGWAPALQANSVYPPLCPISARPTPRPRFICKAARARRQIKGLLDLTPLCRTPHRASRHSGRACPSMKGGRQEDRRSLPFVEITCCRAGFMCRSF